ncbi:hypothetical protein HN777_01475 [Candidatus Woesearchaeota archaeon]|jgi:hypothetical protein|nr:hypothetical protein [Candidatus Woesearchaeota archaeon]MBT7402443.1 hypothetical protein [Candidatus Woesearchaeota archaeon]
MAIPWVLISVVGIALVIAGLAIYMYKTGKGKIKPWTYDKWLESGAIFLIIAYIGSKFGRDIEVLGMLGIIYAAIGLIGKHVLKGNEFSNKQRNYLTIGLLITVLLGFAVLFLIK